MISKREKLREIDFSLKSLEKEVVDHISEIAIDAPIIGISTNHNHVDENTLTDTYANCVRAAGGIPLIIPMGCDVHELLSSLRKCDGLIMSGGGDIHPLWLGDDPHYKVGKIDTLKDYYDLVLIKGALSLGMPILGICRGMQLLNVALGGTLIQDLPAERSDVDEHSQTATRYEVWQKAFILDEGRLKCILDNSDEVLINSFHHQAIKEVAPSGVISARAGDGTIEAIDFYPEHHAMGVQWHPEALACEGKTVHFNLFKHLVHESSLYSSARSLHSHILTLDSHVDTPSIAVRDETFDFMQYSRKALVDYPKMVAGQLDAVIMAAYVPQRGLTLEEHNTAYEKVLKMFDATEQMASESDGKVEVVKDIQHLMANKIQRKKSLLKAIENGYAIGDQLERLKEFKEKGVKYITLCHNGDNLICDSASRSQRTHGGLSPYGEEVVKEMNRLGITVDISHASDDTIMDVLNISTKPIIASHSSCRSLCSHPRNLPDELLRAIAEKGGVIQLCMYSGFVKEEAHTATVLDFVDHIEHAINVAGVNHVGIGTDFDGDGEVIGCRNTSAIIHITMELIRRGYSKSQIGKIWGANILRILE
ncbi:membrane dipeptidase [Porphyromonadaceae bacterium W3.11]|nr:membrane dipeptidase [Porphyromonadaceae bacterium W3.11]